MDKTPSIDVGNAANVARIQLMAMIMQRRSQADCDAAQAAIQAAIDEERLRNAVSGPGNPFDITP